MVCGQELVYQTQSVEKECFICKQKCSSNAECSHGHFICDTCHKVGTEEIISALCKSYSGTNPVKLAMQIMNAPVIKMHGPEHHYMVPAVLLTTFYNATKHPNLIAEKLSIAIERSQRIPGGFCGSHGNCGAGVGTGIFVSIITDSTPLAVKGWQQSNLMTANSLRMIALAGGPRCCKRDSFIAIDEAIDFVKENFQVQLEKEMVIKCHYSHNNKQCLMNECKFYKN